MSQFEQPKLRVATILNSFIQPAWVARIIQNLHDSTFFEIGLVVKIDNERNKPLSSNGKTNSNGTPLLWKAYSMIDNRTLTPYADPFEPIDLFHLLKDVETLNIKIREIERLPRLTDQNISKVSAGSIDVALDFTDHRFDGLASAMAKNGVWTFYPAGHITNGSAPQGFLHLMRGITTIDFILGVTGPDLQQDSILYKSSTATDLYSMKGTRSKLYWKSANAILRELRKVNLSGPGYLKTADETPMSNLDSVIPPMLTNWNAVVFLSKIARRRLGLRVWNWLHKDRWFLAYKLGTPDFPPKSLSDFSYMIPPKGKFWADPFPIERMGKYYIFMEEFDYSLMKAHISVIEMETDGKWKEPVKVLERDYHLSYPFIFEWEGDLYMIPESKKNRTVELYRCVKFPTQWEFQKVLIGDIQAVDSTLCEAGGKWWLFCNVGGKEFSSNDELHIFYADTPVGDWKPHKNNPVKSDVKSSRPAGRLFWRGGELYRPSQDCSVRMGGAMVINRVKTITIDSFQEEEASRIEPGIKGIYGAHTLNTTTNLTMVDFFDYRLKSLL